MDVEAIFGSRGGQLQGLSLNLVTWIRNAWQPPPGGMPDSHND